MVMDRNSGSFNNRLTRFRPLYGLHQNTVSYDGDVLGELKMLAERYTEQGRYDDAEQMLQLVRSIDPLSK